MSTELYFLRKSASNLHQLEFVIKTDDRDEAYAALAAPELLEALALMVETFAPNHEADFKGMKLTHFNIARAAIAKAKGGQS
jgi:hypothetical protein